MAEESKQLIEQITRQVMAALSQGQSQGQGQGTEGQAKDAPPPAAPSGPVSIHPPIGICTGDYSKFPELAGKAIGGVPPQTLPVLTALATAATTPAPAPASKPADAPAAPPPAEANLGPVLTGIVTAKQLESVHGSTVRLAPSARLTPLALDFVKQRKMTVERAAPGGEKAQGLNAASTQWLWWIDGHCPSVDQVTADLRHSITALSTRRASTALPEAVREIAKRAATNRAAGAILFVHSAAQAGCLANRCQSLRAVVGTSGEAVEEGLRFLAANVLILEYPHLGPKAMRTFVERFITAERKTLADVQKMLKELGTCA